MRVKIHIEDLMDRYNVRSEAIHLLMLEGRLPYPSNHKEHPVFKRFWFLHNVEKYDHLVFELFPVVNSATLKQTVGA